MVQGPVRKAIKQQRRRTSERAERSKEAIARAFIDLIREGNKRPKAPEVAARAGVSERLVYHHFKHMETLFEEAGRITAEDRARLLPDISPELPFKERLQEFIRTRSKAYEFLAPTRRYGWYHAYRSPQLYEGVLKTCRFEMDQACRTFGPELRKLRGARREEARELLAAAVSWEFWEILRTRQRLSVPKAKSLYEKAILKALEVS